MVAKKIIPYEPFPASQSPNVYEKKPSKKKSPKRKPRSKPRIPKAKFEPFPVIESPNRPGAKRQYDPEKPWNWLVQLSKRERIEIFNFIYDYPIEDLSVENVMKQLKLRSRTKEYIMFLLCARLQQINKRELLAKIK